MARAPRKKASANDQQIAETTETTETTMTEATTAPKKTRAPAKPRDVFAVVEILDDEGNAVAFDKTKIRLLNIETNASKVLDLVDGSTNPHALLLRGKLAPARAS